MTTVTARALFDNVADSPDELAFRKGDLLVIVDTNPAGLEGQGWWLCSLRGREGLCPGNRLKALPVGVYQGKQSSSTVSLNSTSSARVWNSSGGSTSSETSSSSSLHYRSQRPMVTEAHGNTQTRKVVKPVRMGDSFVYLTNGNRDSMGSTVGSHAGTDGIDLPDYDVPRNRSLQDHGGDSFPCYDVPKPHSDLYDSPRPVMQTLQPFDQRGKNSDRSSGVSLLSSSSGCSYMDTSNTSSDSLSLSSIYPGSIASREVSTDAYSIPRLAVDPQLKSRLFNSQRENQSLDETSSRLVQANRMAKSVDFQSSSDSLDLYDVPPNRFDNPSPLPGNPNSISGTHIQGSVNSQMSVPMMGHPKLPPKTLSKNTDIKPKIMVDREQQDYDTPLPAVSLMRDKLSGSFRDNRAGISHGNSFPLPPKLGRARPASTDSDLMQDYCIPQPRGQHPPILRQNSKSEPSISEAKSDPVYGRIIRNDNLSEFDQCQRKVDELRLKSIMILEKVLSSNLKAPFTEVVFTTFKEITVDCISALECFLEYTATHLKTCKKFDSVLYNRLESLMKPLINARRILRDVLGTLDSIPLSTLQTVQKRLLVCFEQLTVCARNSLGDIKEFSTCFHDNAKKIFRPPPEEWIDDYDYVKLESRQTGVTENDAIVSNLPMDLQALFRRMVKDSTSIVPANPPDSDDSSLLLFYQPYVQEQQSLLLNCIDVFLYVIESKQQPSVFINFAKFIVITAFKLVFMGDSIARHAEDKIIASSVSEYSESLCSVVKFAVEAVNRGARDFPALDAVQEMFDAVANVSQKGSDLNANISKRVN